ncbi:MAG: methyltransferase domain-containing protein [Candidatus Moranbacteria bacterium]|jgi:2-polyprenyl-3-methyl-5-hydroxy-6-metoxy-1,4-benzoquinol methylase|nr:methyltransferase domain-containing protein [Candidatus Moranbacteria bacterium]
MKYFDKINNQLIFIKKKSTPMFWDKHWENFDISNEIKKGSRDQFISRITKRYITPSTTKKILEGGCGMGQFVYSLEINGYNAYGIDYAKKTIKKINESMPSLKISFGNVQNTQFPDNFFHGYWSLGVIEHFFEGYDNIISEMSRIIKPKGYLFITFPYMSPIRKIKSRFGLYTIFSRKKFQKNDFYQFALDYKKVQRDIEKKGFSLVKKMPFDGIKGLKDEITIIKPLLQKIYDSQNIFIRILKITISALFSPLTSHSILLVFKKND